MATAAHQAETRSVRVAGGVCYRCGKSAPAQGKKLCAGCAAYQADKIADSNGRLKQEVFWAYGSECSCCGEREQAFLALDHVNGGGAAERRELGHGYPIYRKCRREGFPGTYQLLCHNCNNAKHILGICPHQSGAPDPSRELKVG